LTRRAKHWQNGIIEKSGSARADSIRRGLFDAAIIDVMSRGSRLERPS
jgi:hypothetical protein